MEETLQPERTCKICSNKYPGDLFVSKELCEFCADKMTDGDNTFPIQQQEMDDLRDYYGDQQ